MCGLCLAHCPTYRLSRNEAESPRGRIALMTALARGQLDADAALANRLDHCLQCGACEAMCPSGVPYGELIDVTMAQLHSQRPAGRRRLQAFALNHLLLQPQRLRRAFAGLRLLQRGGMLKVAAGLGSRIGSGLDSGNLSRAMALLPVLSSMRRWQTSYPATSDTAPFAGTLACDDQTAASVALFTGCLGAALDSASNDAAIVLLNRLGYRVELPAAQTCCGALHQHSGEPAIAARLAATNRAAFAGHSTIVATASACAQQLRGSRCAKPGSDPDGAPDGDPGSAAPAIIDASQFIANAAWPTDLVPAELAADVALHSPCSQCRTGPDNSADATRRLLQRIPALRLHELATCSHCCGAAGSYMLREPVLSDRLGREVIAAAVGSGATLLLSSNIGCLIQLSALARRDGHAIEVLHPLTLLARQLSLPIGGAT